MPRIHQRAVRFGTALFFLLLAEWVLGHLDAPRVPLSQLFLDADFVAVASIEQVERRNFGNDDQPSTYEVVTARISDQYKGEELGSVEFFQYAHGHADYQAGDVAVLFLDRLDDGHQLSAIGAAGGIRFVSYQVRNNEHRLSPAEIENYRWVLEAYAGPSRAPGTDATARSRTLETIMLKMLRSDSPRLAESALLDLVVSGNGIRFTPEELKQLELLVRNPGKPIGFRLALLREMSRREWTDHQTWTYLLEHETDANLVAVLRSLADYEYRELQNRLAELLQAPSPFVTESAAMALAHPVYAGAEKQLNALLASENQRLNYAAIDGLLGINTPLALELLSDAEVHHPNPKVRRMIAARLKDTTESDRTSRPNEQSSTEGVSGS